jgi:hypothetical protein
LWGAKMFRAEHCEAQGKMFRAEECLSVRAQALN